MINSIYIQNFQSHKDTKLEFSDGVNIIVGGSDSGKTAVLRALRWLVWNRPSGEAFRSDWGGDTGVVVDTDGHTITRSKTDKTNGYALDDTLFTAFGTEVPEDIQKLLRLNDINLQSQLDSPFLLSKSAGEVAAHFNKVAHLEKIDTSLQSISSWLRRLERDVDAQEAALTDNQERLQEYADIDKIETHVELLEQDQERLQNQFAAILRLEKAKDNIIHYSKEISVLEPFILAEAHVKELLDHQAKAREVNDRVKTLQNAVRQITALDKEIQQQSDVLRAEKQVNEMLVLFKQLDSTRSNYNALGQLVFNVNTTTDKTEKKINALERLELEFEESFPDTCPLCGKPK